MTIQRPVGIDSRSGAILVAVILILIVATFLAHGMMLLAQQERLASAAGRDRLRARTAAESAVREAIGRPSPDGRLTTAVWTSSTARDQIVDGIDVTTAWFRVDREVWYVGSRASVGVATFSAARTVWTLDPATRVLRMPGVVSVGPDAPVRVSGQVSSDRVLEVARLPPGIDCESRTDARVDEATVASIAIWGTFPPDVFGSLTDSMVSRRLAGIVEGSGRAEPRSGFGRCDENEPWNWGDPMRSGRPCSSYLVGRRAPLPLLVEGGVGQGLLILEAGGVLRDLSFFGLVVSRGPLTLAGATVIVGLVSAAGGVTIESGASVEGSACWARAALSIPQLLAPVHFPETGWVGPIR
jgi:hypothetical protein